MSKTSALLLASLWLRSKKYIRKSLAIEARAIFFMHVACNVLDDFLFLGSARSLRRSNLVKEKAISLVINATVDVPHPDHESSEIECVRIPVEDKPDAILSVYFDVVSDKIEEARISGKSVLVHCNAGISRSPTLVVAYLMKHKMMTLSDAYSHVKSRRLFVQPKPGFWKQLMEFEHRLYQKNTVTMEGFSRELTCEFHVKNGTKS